VRRETGICMGKWAQKIRGTLGMHAPATEVGVGVVLR
jgi:hypothetical protein